MTSVFFFGHKGLNTKTKTHFQLYLFCIQSVRIWNSTQENIFQTTTSRKNIYGTPKEVKMPFKPACIPIMKISEMMAYKYLHGA